MKEHPLRFTGPMVRALLDASKTQTRLVVKTELVMGHESFCAKRKKGYAHVYLMHRDFDVVNMASDCPYGQTGDRLWVRETWQKAGGNTGYWYRATDDKADDGESPVSRWKPSIHMPRAASRITLEITGVRVERLQAISETDAQAEGVYLHDDGKYTNYLSPTGFAFNAVSSYASLWESINGPDSWTENPWVWVIEFKVVQA